MKNILEARGITKRIFGKQVIDSVSLSLQKGQCIGVVGPYKSGKSSLMRLLSGQIQADSGELFVNDIDAKIAINKIKSFIGVVPGYDDLDRELSPLMNLTVFANFFGLDQNIALGKATELFREFKIDDIDGEILDNLDKDQIRKLSFCRALIHNPEILIIDEPTVQVSTRAKLELWQSIKQLKKQKKSLIVATEDLKEVEEICDKVIVLSNGRVIAEGAPKQLVKEQVGEEIVEFKINRGDVSYYTDKLRNQYEYAVLDSSVRLFLKTGQSHKDAIRHFSSEKILIRKASLEDVYIKIADRNSSVGARV